MSLPVAPLPSREVRGVTVHGLSRAAAVHLGTSFTPAALPGLSVEERVEAGEVYLLVQGAGVSEDEARAWRATSDPAVASAVLDAILELSGLAKEKGEPDPQA